MTNINRIRVASIWIFIVPFFVINTCLLISTNYYFFDNTIFSVDQIGRSNFTIPYIDGGLSISRAVRTYPTYLLFKPGMLITAVLLIIYWIENNKLFKKIEEEENKNKKFIFFGIGSAIFLILHSICLGVDFENDIYKFLKRVFLLGFIIFEIIAQALLLKVFFKTKLKISIHINQKILYLKMILVSILIIVAFLSAPFLNSPDYTHFKHALEWNYFVGVITFYLFTFLLWKKRKKPVHTPEGA